MVDPQPHSPGCLTFEAQDTVADNIDHGSHNVDIPVKGHFQEAGQPREDRTRDEEHCDRAGRLGAI